MDLANTSSQEGESKGGIQMVAFASPSYCCPKVPNCCAIFLLGENSEGNRSIAAPCLPGVAGFTN